MKIKFSATDVLARKLSTQKSSKQFDKMNSSF